MRARARAWARSAGQPAAGLCVRTHPGSAAAAGPGAAFLSRCQSRAVSRCSAITAPPARTSSSVQRHASFPCLWSETLESAGIQAQGSFQRALQAVRDVFCLYVRTSKDFSSAAAKAGGEEISPRYQFDTWPRHKPFLNKILIETAQKGTAVLQNLKHCRIRINFKLLC